MNLSVTVMGLGAKMKHHDISNIRPSLSRMTLLQSLVISGLCMTMTMVRPSSCKFFIIAVTSSLLFRSRLPVGSSAIMILGSFASAWAIAALCFSPPEMLVGLKSTDAQDLKILETPKPSPSPLSWDLAQNHGHLNILQNGDSANEIEGLKDEPQFFSPYLG
jgi:hypothetical protein